MYTPAQFCQTLEFHNIYRGKGPVLTAVSVEPAEKPLEEVVTFS